MARIKIAVVGLGFGSAFVPIYQAHPDVSEVGICDADPERLQAAGAHFGISRRHSSLEEVLAHDYEAIHLLTPVPLHVEQTLAVLRAGMHCACAVPMATDLDDLRRIIDETRQSGRNYMMMETGAYSREYLYAKSLYDAGDLGPVTFLRGTYYQDLEGDYPLYWKAQPPMHYATHVVGPILALMETRATKVHCLGAGVLKESIQQPGGNTFPLQTAIFRMEGTPAVAEVTRAWFQTARAYTESFSVYGEHRGFEWQQIESEDPVVFTLPPNDPAVRWRDPAPERVCVPFRPDLLPEPLKPFADGGHGGSHPHLVHEFIRSIVEGRPAAINEIVSADWCAPGICANLSSLRDGESVQIPTFV